MKVEGRWAGRGYLDPASVAVVRATDDDGRGPAYEHPAVADTAYEDGKVAEAAAAELRQFAARRAGAGGQPFFLAVGFEKPHLPFNAPQRYWDLYPPETVRLPDDYAEPEGVTPYSLTTFGELRNYPGIPREGDVPDSTARALVRGYLAATSFVDAQVGRVLDALDAAGLAENTVVVVWGDHGYKLGEHRSWVKHTNFETDTHIPLLVRAPGVTRPGERVRGFVETVDVYPTLAELAGVGPPPAHQGLSFVPLLREPGRPWKTAAFSQFPRTPPDGDVMGRSVRTDRWRYTEWRRRATGEVLARELFDHAVDPGETVNLAGDPAAADALAHMAAVLHAGPEAARPPAE